MGNGEGRQPDLGPIREGVVEPTLSFVLCLRGLYEESGWSSLQSFADAVGYSRGTISRFLAGERRPTTQFLDKLFAAMECRTGRPVADAVREETRRMYFECIREKAPAEYQVFQLEERLKAAHREMRQQLNAHDADRNVFGRQIAELTDTLRHVERQRDELLQRCDHLDEQRRGEVGRRKFLGPVLAEVVRLHEGLALTRPLERWGPLTGLAFRDPSGTAGAVALSPGGALIVNGGSDNTLRFWEPALSRSPMRVLHHDRPVLALDFDAGQHLLATACQDESVWLWRLTDGQAAEPAWLNSTITDVRALAFAPRGDGLLAVAGVGGRTVELWNTRHDRSTSGSPNRPVNFLRDENGKPPPPGTVVGRFSGYRREGGFKGHEHGVNALAFSTVSDVLATAGVDGTVRLWAFKAGMPTAGPLTGHEGAVQAVAFSPDGRRIATGGADGTVRLWDPVGAASSLGRPLIGHAGPVRCVAFSPDGHLVASVGDDATARCWSPATGRPVGEPFAGHSGPVVGLCFSRDGAMFSTAGTDGTVRLWSTPTAGR